MNRLGLKLACGAGLVAAAIVLTGGTGVMAQKGKPPPPPAAPRQIAFHRSTNSGPYDIFAMYGDGSGELRLTTTTNGWQTASFAPIWSPGGARIAYMYGYPTSYTVADIYSMKPDGSDKRLVLYLHKNVGWLQWSPDGRYISYTIVDNSANPGPREVNLVGPFDPVTALPAAGFHTTSLTLWSDSIGIGSWTPDLDTATAGYQGKLLMGFRVNAQWAVRWLDIAIDTMGGLSYDPQVASNPASWPVLLADKTHCAIARTPSGGLRALFISSPGGLTVADVEQTADPAGLALLEPYQVLFPTDLFYSHEKWSGDGSQIVYIRGADASSPGQLEVFKATVPAVLGTTPGPAVRLTFTRRDQEYAPYWVPPVF